MKKQDLNERIFDEVLKDASEDYVEQIDSQWPPEDELDSEHTFSPEFNKKMELIFTEQKKRERIMKIKRSFVKVAVIVLLFITASFLTVMSVDAIRVRILNYFIERSEKSTTYFMDHESSGVTIDAEGIALPTYLPSGYRMVSFVDIGDYFLFHFKDDAGNELILEILAEDSIVGIDSENAYIEHIKVNSQPAEYFVKNNISTIVYKFDDRIYVLSGPLIKDELVKITESME